MIMDWAEKYRPKELADIVGNRSAVHQLLDWAKDWTSEHKPVLLYGKPGIGKTSTAYALARDLGWEIIELNASDQRTKGAIERIAGSSSVTASLSGARRRLILLDEADNLEGNADRGGAKAIADIIRHSRQPIILIANDAYGVAPEVRKLCEQIQFRAVPARSLAPYLRGICASEGLHCDEEAIRMIAEDAQGDIRSALNMLFGTSVGRDRITPADLHAHQKDSRSTIFDLIAKTISGSPDDTLIRLSYEVEDTPDAVIQWLEGAVAQHREGWRRASGLCILSRADLYIGRTFRRQYYTLWRYASAIMLIGSSTISHGSGLRPRLAPPGRWQRMGQARRQKQVRLSLENRLSEAFQIPQRTISEEYLTFISRIADYNPTQVVRLLNLDTDQLGLLIHDKLRAGKIIKEMEKEAKDEAKRKKVAQRGKEEQKTLEKTPSSEKSAPEKKQPSQSTLFSF